MAKMGTGFQGSALRRSPLWAQTRLGDSRASPAHLTRFFRELL